jgi:hypothetical protein
MRKRLGVTRVACRESELMNPISLFLLTVSTVLVLRSGDRIEVQGPIREENGRIVFRVAGGALYSVAAHEIDRDETQKAAYEKPAEQSRLKLRVSAAERDRLLKELEKNHIGRPGKPGEPWPAELPPAAEAQGPASVDSRDEWAWRREARAYEEQVRRAEENLALLLDRIDQLENEISGFLSLGYRPLQFHYQTTQLAYARVLVLHSQLEDSRPTRAYQQSRTDSTRQD